MATIVIRCGFQSISFDGLRKSTIEKGKNLVKSQHVHNVEEFCGTIRGLVMRQTSVTMPPYKVELDVSTVRML